jgi:hypothetical protein
VATLIDSNRHKQGIFSGIEDRPRRGFSNSINKAPSAAPEELQNAWSVADEFNFD